MRFLDRVIDAIASLMLFAIAVLMFTEVMIRMFFPDYILTWQEEAARSLLVYLSMLGGASALYHRQHFTMPMVLRKLRASIRRMALLGSLVLILVYSVVWLFVAIRWVEGTANTYTPALQWDYRVIYAALPIGGLLLTLFAIHLLVRQWQSSEPIELGVVEAEQRTD